ncbi:MAG: alkaline phosphatase PhoX [Micromonosporaceae bacterium]
MERRTLLRGAVVGMGAAAFGGSLWRGAFAGGPLADGQGGPLAGGPYGPLHPADANGVRLPSGFTSRIVARSSQQVPGTSYTWHSAPDGGACFADGSGWIYVSNSEIATTGGAGAIRFGADGSVTGAYRILDRTNRNCAGGATPWNTWLSCEEVSYGAVFETDPYGAKAAVRHPAMGLFKHEAAAVDADRRVVYMTEDETDGNFYRYTPSAWPDLSAGNLEVLTVTKGKNARAAWVTVPDPSGTTAPTRNQVRGAKRFNGGEGCHYGNGVCYFTTKGDNRVWAYDAAANTLGVLYDDSSPLSGVDNITGATSGDLFVAEDGGNMEICMIEPSAAVSAFARLVDQDSSEICGPAFSPDGRRLYFSSQRGTSGSSSGGLTYEVTGPFRS